MILAVLQARTSSSRLPGKVLKPILGMPMLLRQIERINRAKKIDKLIVATSNHESDDKLAEVCFENNIECFRGSLNDVLDRFYQAAKLYEPEHLVRLTGDCPLADPAVIDRVITTHVAGNYDYTSNTIEPTYPDGLDVEVFRTSCLDYAWREATLSSQREHVTLFIYQHPELFSLGSVKHAEDLSSLRWTVDEPSDFILVNHIYENLYPHDPAFTTDSILEYLQCHEQLKNINSQFRRNEGLEKSLQKDYLEETERG